VTARTSTGPPTVEAGRWVRRPGRIEIALDGPGDGTWDQAEAVPTGLPARPLTSRDVIDPRIDPCAQFALLRLRASGAGGLADAAGLLGALKSGALAGIYGANLLASVKLAQKLGTVWWRLLPDGEDAVLIFDPTDPLASPTIVFRAIQTATGPQKCLDKSRLDPALRKAWQSFQAFQAGKLVRCEAPVAAGSTQTEAFGPTVIANIIPPFCAQPRVPLPAPSPKPRPGTAKPIGRDELMSWCHPYDRSPLIGQIYFKTNSTNLGPDDTAALDRLVEAFNELGDRHKFDPIGILFLGHADFRPTTFPGGNEALADDRAGTCHDYFVTRLTSAALESVEVHSQGKGVDPTLVQALQRLGDKRELILSHMRMTAIMRPDQPPIVRPRKPIPPKDCAEAHARGRDVLKGWAAMFTSEERRHLAHLCKDETVRDAYLNGMDPELQKIVFGIGGQMTDAEAETFANRFHACTDLMHPFSTGPNADDLDVVGALRGLHSRIEQGIDQLVVAAALEESTGFPNRRRGALSAFVTLEMQNSRSLYFRWL
jgi:outer membrane protein OmpA-like peptidoglycan-associated protein